MASEKKKIDSSIKAIFKEQKNLYFIHYSCQNLSDDNEGYSPRITSIAVLHMASDQMYSFSMHLVAEEMKISRDDIINRYDEIESRMLRRFFDFAQKRDAGSTWIHWNMTNINFGFEALEHRYRVLTNEEPYLISDMNKHNLSKLISKKFGHNYVGHPKMLTLMELNGGRNRNFLTGEEEVSSYKAKEFVKLHNSTMCKVYFFKHAFYLLSTNKLRTETNQLKFKINELYQHPAIQVLAILGVIGTLISVIITIL